MLYNRKLQLSRGFAYCSLLALATTICMPSAALFADAPLPVQKHAGVAAPRGAEPVAKSFWQQYATLIACVAGGVFVSGIGLAWSFGRRGRSADDRDSNQLHDWSQAKFIEKRQGLLRAFANQPEKHLRGQLLVEDIMTRRLTTARPGANLASLRRILPKGEIRHIPICDHDGSLLGIVSDRDLRAGKGRTAADIMTRQPATVARNVPILVAATQMLQRRISSVLVVDGNKLVGIVTTTDLVLVLQCLLHMAYHDNDESIFDALQQDALQQDSLQADAAV